MSTPAQIAANRQSELSTGPTSPEGRQIVASNAVKHQLTGTGNPALPGEKEAVAKHLEGYMQAFAPVGVPERTFVSQHRHENYWRLQRALGYGRFAVQQNMFGKIGRRPDPFTLLAEAWLDPTSGLKSVAIYAARIQRAIEKNTTS